MKDNAAQLFCWQGSAAKLPLKSLSVTLAIKRKAFKRHSFSVSHLFTFFLNITVAFNEKFGDHGGDMEFEANTIAFFQQARNRINKKATKT